MNKLIRAYETKIEQKLELNNKCLKIISVIVLNHHLPARSLFLILELTFCF